MIVAHILEDNRDSGNFLALVIDNGLLELQFTLDLDVNVSILKSSVPLQPNSWFTAVAGYQNGLVFLQVNDEPKLTERISKHLFSHHRDHFLYLGGLDGSVPKYQITGQSSGMATDFDGCLKQVGRFFFALEIGNKKFPFVANDLFLPFQLKISDQTIDVTKSFLYARNVENCK